MLCHLLCSQTGLARGVSRHPAPALQIRMRATSSQPRSPSHPGTSPLSSTPPSGSRLQPPCSPPPLQSPLGRAASHHLPPAFSHRLHPQKAAPEARPRPLTEEGITHIPKGSGLVYIKIKTLPHAGLDSHREGGSWTAHLSTLLSGRRDARGLRHTALPWLVELFGNFPGVND